MSNVYVAMDNIRSLYNVGSIFRTCSFLGFEKVILVGYSGTKFNFKNEKVLHPKLEKTSLGAEEDVESTFIENAEELFHFAKDNKLKIISVEQKEGSTLLKDFKHQDNIILVFGNELKGVSKEILEISSEIVEIEQVGNKKSLNVATAAGIVLSHMKK